MSEKRTIAALFDESVSAGRTNPMYLVEGPPGTWREVSWREAAEAVDEIAHGLLSLGVKKGDAFGVLAHTMLEWALFDFAMAHIGAVAAPIYPSSTPAECRHVLTDSQAIGVIVENDEELPRIEESRSLPGLKHILTFADLDDLRARGREHREQHPDAVREAAAQITDDDLFTFIYTSGTTGPPKGCMILNRNYFEMVNSAILAEALFEQSDTLLLYLPLAHNFGRFMHLLGPRIGLTVAFCPDPRRLGEVMPAVKPTIMPTVPRVLEKVHTGVSANFASATGTKKRLIDWALGVGRKVSERRQQRQSVPATLAAQHRLADRLVYSKVKDRLGGRMRAVISGGAPLSKEIAEFFHALDVQILEGYGQTEGTTASTCNLPDNYRFGTVGQALPNIEVRIDDDGEILIKGPTVFGGYFGNEEATREVLGDDGWLRTGDVGELDRDGFLKITDRKKDLIVTAGGKNLSPQNIENDLKGSQYISQALVVGDRRPFVSALITLDEEEIGKWAKARGLNGDVAGLASRQEVKELIQGELDKVNEELAHFEQVRAFAILPRDFSPDENEVTPTLKLRRRICEEHFASEIEALYA